MCEFTGCLDENTNSEQTTPDNADIEFLPPTAKRFKESNDFADTALLRTAKRFKKSSDTELKEFSEGYKPKNTVISTNWSIKTFQLWQQERNCFEPNSIPTDLFTSKDPALLSRYLSLFVIEVRKKSGEKYPPATLHQLLCGILRHMRQINDSCPNFMDKQDLRFKQLHNTLDSLFHKLHSEGVGVHVKHAEVITADEEMKLWESGIMGMDNPCSLQNAVFFTVGKVFCLRGGQEHRDLKISQFIRLKDPDRFVYHENTSKNKTGTYKHIHVKPKIVPIFAIPEAGERCPINILDKYIEKLPKEAFLKDLFYLRPLASAPTNDTDPWYTCVPVGKNTLNNKIKLMCEKAKISGNKTNHSLRVTGATTLFENGVPEKIIKERTGHRSLEALRTYERTTDKQNKEVSNLLAITSKNQKSINVANKSDGSVSYSFENLQGCSITINSNST